MHAFRRLVRLYICELEFKVVLLVRMLSPMRAHLDAAVMAGG